MKVFYLTAIAALMASSVFSQVEEEVVEQETVVEEEIIVEKLPPDTTRIRIGKKEIIVVGDEVDVNDDFEDEFPEEKKTEKKHYEAHWSGLEFGFTTLMNADFESRFPTAPYWQNDAARSQTWNLNLLEHKFKIAREYVGLTTGLGFSFTSVALKNNYLLESNADSVFATIDSVYTYSKNKLKSSYLTIPLLLEFGTNAEASKSFYFATGIIGGVRIASKVKRVGEIDGKEFKQKLKGTYGLSSFRADATARLGYGSWGCFVNYNVLPLFDKGATVDVYPLTFGLSLNFN